MSAAPAGTCAETTGFLIDRTCPRPAELHCSTCQKPICRSHSASRQGVPYCATCVKEQGRRTGGNARSRLNQQSDYDDYTPYFYTGYLYHGYGYYGRGYWGYDHYAAHDFTEADGTDLTAADGNFEHDVGAS